MKANSRIAVLAVTGAVAAAGSSAPALGASKWSHSKCVSYAKKYSHSSKSRKSAANKTLKGHGCTNRVK